MDIRRLVDHVADALGADASEERVEKIAAAILEANRDNRSSGDQVIITVYGYDKPGILAAITQVVFEAGCNITDVTQQVLGSYFTMIMIADLSGARQSLAELQSALTRTGERVGVRIIAQHQELFARIHRP